MRLFLSFSILLFLLAGAAEACPQQGLGKRSLKSCWSKARDTDNSSKMYFSLQEVSEALTRAVIRGYSSEDPEFVALERLHQVLRNRRFGGVRIAASGRLPFDHDCRIYEIENAEFGSPIDVLIVEEQMARSGKTCGDIKFWLAWWVLSQKISAAYPELSNKSVMLTFFMTAVAANLVAQNSTSPLEMLDQIELNMRQRLGVSIIKFSNVEEWARKRVDDNLVGVEAITVYDLRAGVVSGILARLNEKSGYTTQLNAQQTVIASLEDSDPYFVYVSLGRKDEQIGSISVKPWDLPENEAFGIVAKNNAPWKMLGLNGTETDARAWMPSLSVFESDQGAEVLRPNVSKNLNNLAQSSADFYEFAKEYEAELPLIIDIISDFNQLSLRD